MVRTMRAWMGAALVLLAGPGGAAAQAAGDGVAVERAVPAIEQAATLLPDASEARVLVLGELHGTNEAPALASAAVQRRLDAGGPVTLALEIHAAEQPRLDAFVASRGDAAAREALLQGEYWRTPAERSDGRRSVAMLALIESMQRRRAAGDDVRVLAFDAGNAGGGAPRRNERMAAVLREAMSSDPQRAFVVLIGNYHARRAAPNRIGGLMPGESAPVPTMAHLADVPMLRVKVIAARVEFWTCMDGACGPQRMGAEGGMGVDEAELPIFRRTPGDADPWDAQLVLPQFSVAEPVVAAPPTG